MSELMQFHFLRPWWLLLLLPPGAMIWLQLRQQSQFTRWKNFIAPHLLQHLLVSEHKVTGQKTHTIEPVWLMALLLSLMVIAVSGPAWQKKPGLFSDDKTEVMLVLKVTDSMLEKDLSPTRLSRAAFKINDLLQVRSRIRAGLVAYSGSAHLVMPITEDRQIINSFAASLEPAIMPVKGDALGAAVKLAEAQFSRSGTIIILTDSINKAQANALYQQQKNSANKNNSILLFAISSPELLNRRQFEQAASILKTDWVNFAYNDQDIELLSNYIDSYFQQALNNQSDYEDAGYYLMPFISLLVLLWFRQGFLAQAWRLS